MPEVSATPSQQARAPVLTTAALERTRAVVEEVLGKAARDGEKVVCYARIVLCGVIAVIWPVTTFDEMKNGEPSDFVVVGMCSLALMASLGMLWYLRTHSMTSVLRTVSIVLDALVVLVILGSFVWRPPPTYFGFGRMSGIGAAYFAVLGAGIRLSRRGALLSLAIVAAGFTAFIAVDIHNDVADTMANRLTIAALMLNAGVFSWLIAARTRKLVLEGAEQTLMAERARSRLGAYVSEEVAAHSLASDEMRMGGARQEVAILFSDLRSFTTASEKAEPEQIVRELNEYFEVMVAAVQDEGGVVDKYIGDSIMAVFGAPTPRPDDAARAVRAAFAMEKALVILNVAREKRGLAPLRHGIGVHRGAAVAGNIGTTTRAQYTVIGDTVNVAARLESCTKDLGVSVLLSSAVVERVQGAPGMPAFKSVGAVKAKGRDEPV
ncbi:MAG TPA: adenylate/guanylate cyclase domain-containing protein, partial [Myxococcota bacterium]